MYWFCFIDNQEIDCEYRYKTIVSLKNTYSMRKICVDKEERARLDEDYEFFDKNALFHFALNINNIPTMRILASQSILVKYNIDDNILEALLSISNDQSVEYNIKSIKVLKKSTINDDLMQ